MHASLLPLAFALSLSVVPAAQDPVLEPALTLSGDLAPTEAGGEQRGPYLAAGGPGALAVWVDHRAELTSPLGDDGGPDLYALRLDPAGQPLDPVAIRLPFFVGEKQYPKAAWNGSSWLVTWENQQPLGTSPYFRVILGARIAADGTVLDPDPIVIKDDLSTIGSSSAVASDGDGWVVTAQGTDQEATRIVALRVSAAGVVLNPGGTKIVDVPYSIGQAELEYAGTYLLAWAAGPVRGQRFSSTLAPLGGVFTIGSGSGGFPSIATDGADFLVAWQTPDFSTGEGIRARTVDAATGAQSPVVAVTPSFGEYFWQPDVAWSGDVWHVAFRDSGDDVYRDARIAPDLTVLDFGGVALPFGDENGGSIALAGAPGGVTAAFERWEFTQPWPGAILAAGIDDALNVGPQASLSLSATRQAFPAVAAGPAQLLVAFQGEEQASVSIEVQRLDPFGAPLDPEPLVLDAGTRLGKPAVAWNGSVYLVVWEDLVNVTFETDDVVLGTRVAPDGSVLDPAPFVVMEGSMPDVAANGDEFLVVASNAPTTEELRYAFARRVGSDGALAGASVQVGGSFARWPAVAAYQDGWVVLWQRNFSHDNPNSVVDGALVGAGGTPGSTFSVDGAPGFGGASRPAVASRGDSALLVWQDDFTGLAARVLGASGALEPPFQVAALPALPAGASVAWNGEEYLVAWEDYRALVGLWDYRSDVFAARIAADGTLLDGPSGFALADGPETEIQPAVAGLLGTSWTAFVELLPDAPHATLRARVRRESPWATEGGGVGGPVLQGQGALVPGASAAFHLSGAAPGAPGMHVIGASALALPFQGGVLVPAPNALVPFTTSTSGAASITVPIPPVMPAGLAIHAQAWLLDPGAPFGFAGSNAVTSVAP